MCAGLAKANGRSKSIRIRSKANTESRVGKRGEEESVCSVAEGRERQKRYKSSDQKRVSYVEREGTREEIESVYVGGGPKKGR